MPWIQSYQVEQDIILTKALVQIYSDPHLKDAFAFRGGTSLQKIFFSSPTRYSEDIDLVQVRTEPIGESIDALRRLMDSWLGKPGVDFKTARCTLKYKFLSKEAPQRQMRLKIEINTGEHFNVLGLKKSNFEMQSSWYSGKCEILTNDKKMVDCFLEYMKHGNITVSRAEFESNLHKKLNDRVFMEDIKPLLKPDAPDFNIAEQGELVKTRTLSLLPGDPWKGEPKNK
ncbi:MAG: nucleotidyl transferase AbiEii/AbiGii toxin family protein [Bdellovibrionales bacterium]|nr:nucleotidyl transferase AbiEii/AbiGii toxin family protein [Bdellovibrionales bacterium]